MPNPDIFSTVINGYLPEPHASLLNGILFGIDLTGVKDFYHNLKIVGLLHLVVLSGMNITLIAAMTMIVTRVFHRHISTTLTIVTIILFILFVGPKPPIIRAGIMGVLALTATIYGRKTIALYLLFISAIFVGIFWPDWIKTVSFQLSYGATLGIILFGQYKIKKTSDVKTSLRQSVFGELRITMAAQVFTVPIIFFYFKQISMIAPVANVMVAFTIAPLMIFGFLTAILGKVHFLLGLLPSVVCYGILSYVITVVNLLSSLPFVYFDFK